MVGSANSVLLNLPNIPPFGQTLEQMFRTSWMVSMAVHLGI
jgi:hypothetical protein